MAARIRSTLSQPILSLPRYFPPISGQSEQVSGELFVGFWSIGSRIPASSPTLGLPPLSLRNPGLLITRRVAALLTAENKGLRPQSRENCPFWRKGRDRGVSPRVLPISQD